MWTSPVQCTHIYPPLNFWAKINPKADPHLRVVWFSNALSHFAGTFYWTQYVTMCLNCMNSVLLPMIGSGYQYCQITKYLKLRKVSLNPNQWAEDSPLTNCHYSREQQRETKDNVEESGICNFLEFRDLGNHRHNSASSFTQNKDEGKQDIYGKFVDLRSMSYAIGLRWM